MNLHLQRGIAALALSICAAAAHADVLIDNLDQPVRFPAPLRSDFWYAQSFLTAAGDAVELDQVTVRVGMLLGTPGIVAELRADAVGVPGPVLASFTLPSLGSGATQNELLSTTDLVTLAPATTYWLLMGATGDGGYDWSYAEGNGASGSGSFYEYTYSVDQGASWIGFGTENPLMMRVDVTPVPEPGVAWLLAAGLLIGFLRARAARSAAP